MKMAVIKPAASNCNHGTPLKICPRITPRPLPAMSVPLSGAIMIPLIGMVGK